MSSGVSRQGGRSGRIARTGPATLAATLVTVAAVLLGSAQPAAAAEIRQMQWYLDQLKIPAAQKISTGSGVLVAVIDTGVDAGHPDLAGQVSAALDNSGAPHSGDTDGHGTHMAGIIAAKGGGPGNALGVAPGAKILSIYHNTGTASSSRAIRLAADKGAKVISMSFAGANTDSDLESAIQYAISKDVVLVAGAGNTKAGQRTVQYPAALPGVIAVTGTDKQGSFWSGSAQGPQAVIAAPAQEIANVDSRQAPSGATGYSAGSGTSDSTAIVSGVAALVRSKYPQMNAASVVNRLIRTATDKGPAGRDAQYGFGVVNPEGALTANVPDVQANPLLGPKASGSASPGSSASTTPRAGGGFEGDYADPGDTSDDWIVPTIVFSLIGLVVIAAIVLLVVLLRRRSRGKGPKGGAGPPFPPPGSGGPGFPPPPPGSQPPPQGGFGPGSQPPTGQFSTGQIPGPQGPQTGQITGQFPGGVPGQFPGQAPGQVPGGQPPGGLPPGSVPPPGFPPPPPGSGR